MQLLVPEGANTLEMLFSDSSMQIVEGGHHGTEDPTEADLHAALDAMRQGWIEYVILQDGDEFLQVAGEGDGPYLVQFCPGDPDDMLSAAPARLGDVTAVFTSYLRGDGGWRHLAAWPGGAGGGDPAADRDQKRGGFLGRLLGRG